MVLKGYLADAVSLDRVDTNVEMLHTSILPRRSTPKVSVSANRICVALYRQIHKRENNRQAHDICKVFEALRCIKVQQTSNTPGEPPGSFIFSGLKLSLICCTETG